MDNNALVSVLNSPEFAEKAMNVTTTDELEQLLQEDFGIQISRADMDQLYNEVYAHFNNKELTDEELEGVTGGFLAFAVGFVLVGIAIIILKICYKNIKNAINSLGSK